MGDRLQRRFLCRHGRFCRHQALDNCRYIHPDETALIDRVFGGRAHRARVALDNHPWRYKSPRDFTSETGQDPWRAEVGWSKYTAVFVSGMVEEWRDQVLWDESLPVPKWSPRPERSRSRDKTRRPRGRDETSRRRSRSRSRNRRDSRDESRQTQPPPDSSSNDEVVSFLLHLLSSSQSTSSPATNGYPPSYHYPVHPQATSSPPTNGYPVYYPAPPSSYQS